MSKKGKQMGGIQLFKQLSFKRQIMHRWSGHLQETIEMRACVPGVNSGVYLKQLHITVVQKRPFKFARWLEWKFGREERVYAEISLNEDEMIQLRDEITQILRLPFKENK